MKRFCLLSCLILLLWGCGQSGKLYLPEKAPAQADTAAIKE